jgi:digeranylgeranylglycerophospholipid reductase
VKDQYDIVVVGGGPAGSWAAKHAAEKGVSVLMVEKNREIGIPVRCAEGISEIGLRSLVDIRDSWIARIINGFRLIAPDGTVVESKAEGRGIVLHRKHFDCDLAEMASQAGTDILTKAFVHDLVMQNGQVVGVKLNHMGKAYQISCAIVIGADGVESRIGRWGGLDTRTVPADMETCVQMTLADIDIDPDYIELYFGRQVAPGGYLWIFPKGPDSANVGLGISGTYAKVKKPIEYLREFVNKRFPKAAVLKIVAGGVPVMPTLKEIVRDGLMLVGDAAHQANPVSGAGIGNAMIAGKIAGRVAAEAILQGDVSMRRLSGYAREWHKAEGKNNDRFYRIKGIVDRFSDEDLNRTAQFLLELRPEERTPLQIFKKALYKHPKLILEAVKAFGTS